MSIPSLSRKLGRQALSLAFLTLLTLSAYAQSFTASVRGTVTDDTGAAVPAAKVLVTDADRGTTFRGEADGSGRYVITALPPGNYVLTVDSPWIKSVKTS